MFALLCFDRTESTGESVLARDRRQEGHRDGQNENDTPHYKKDKILIERIQKRFTRMILSIKEFPYEVRLKKLGLWSLEDRRIRADLIEVFKIIHGLSTVNFSTFFEYTTHERTRGHPLKLNKNRVRTDLRQQFSAKESLTHGTKLSLTVTLFARHR